jgi:furry protein family
MRIFVLNGMMRLIWTYLYRCQESASTTHTRLENILKHFFPAHRLNVFPSDDAETALIHIVHFIVARHFDYGSDLALGLMQESTLTSGKQRSISIEALAPERALIGFRAILLSLTSMEQEKRFPVWPSSCDFSTFDDTSQDWPLSGEKLPDLVLSKPSVPAVLERLLPLVATISRILFKTVGLLTIFDEKYAFRPALLVEDVEPQIVRQHPEGKVIYPRSLASQMQLLIALFDSWPRCLHDKSLTSETLDLLLRGLINVEPDVADAASRSLTRLASDHGRITEVLDRFNRFLFGSHFILYEGGGTRLFVESARVLRLWSSVVDTWVQVIMNAEDQDTPGPNFSWMVGARAALHNAEAGGLFLLTCTVRHIRVVGVQVLRQLARVSPHLQRDDSESHQDPLPRPPSILNILNGEGVQSSFLEDRAYLLDSADRNQLAIWRERYTSDALLRLAESDKDIDQRLWRFVFPSFIRLCMDHHPYVVDTWRDTLNAAVLRYHQPMSSLAGITGRIPVTQQSARTLGYTMAQERDRSIAEHCSAIEQWHFWIKALCATAVASDVRPPIARDHTRAPSDLTTQRERLSTARGLFRHLTAFLASEHKAFRDAVVSAFGSIPQSVFATLLEDLQPMTRHILDGRSKTVQRAQGQEHLYASIAHIYQLTAHFVHDPRSLGDHASLHLLLAFVRETRNFLTKSDNRPDPDLNTLRRYFCGVVAHLFDRLNTLKDSDRFISRNTRLNLYRLCEEWCNVARPSETGKQRHAMLHALEARGRAEVDLAALASAASGAMAALCVRSYHS